MGNSQGKPDEPIDVDILIIGAGATGLGAAYRLNQLGLESWAVVDVNGNPGGSAGSIKTGEGFRFDVGQHNIPIKSKHEFFETLKGKVRGHKLAPKTREFSINAESSIDNINTYFNVATNLGRVAAAANVVAGETTFDQWLTDKFGEKEVASVHRALYNKKFSFPTSLISAKAADSLVTQPASTPAESGDANSAGADISELPDSFLYPQEGGQSNFWKAVAKSLPGDNLRFKTEVTSVNLENGMAETKNGGVIHFKYIVSTMAICNFLDILEVGEEAEKPIVPAPTSGSVYVNIGVRGKLPEFAIAGSTDVSDSNISFHRMNFCSKFDKTSCPPKSELLSTIRRVDNKELKESQMEPKKGPYWSVQFEISSGVLNPVDNAGSPDFIEQVISDAVHLGIFKAKDNIVSLKVSQFQNNFAVPVIGSRESLDSGLAWLKSNNIWSRGALGAGLSMSRQNGPDDCFLVGVQAVDNLLFDEEETILGGNLAAAGNVFDVDPEKEIKREDIKRPGEEEDEEEEEEDDEEEEDSEENSEDEDDESEDEEDSEYSSIVVVKKKGKKAVAKKSKKAPVKKRPVKKAEKAKASKSKSSAKKLVIRGNSFHSFRMFVFCLIAFNAR